MKIIAYMSAYNEAEYIEPAVRSVINRVDGMIIIEGAFLETVETGGTRRSNDGTLDILDSLEKEFSNKLHVFEAPTYTQLRQRSLVFDVANYHFPLIARENYWLWLVDADEVYDLENTLKLIDILEKTESDVIKVDSYTFVNDFKHYVRIAFPRCFRIRSGFQYQFSGPNHLIFREENYPLYKWKNMNWRPLGPEKNHEDEVMFYHYSYVKSPERFSQKKREREHLHGVTFKWYLGEDDEVTCPNFKPRIFTGEHPKIMKDHPKHQSLAATEQQ